MFKCLFYRIAFGASKMILILQTSH